jgi:hypothetical protein
MKETGSSESHFEEERDGDLKILGRVMYDYIAQSESNCILSPSRRLQIRQRARHITSEAHLCIDDRLECTRYERWKSFQYIFLAFLMQKDGAEEIGEFT